MRLVGRMMHSAAILPASGGAAIQRTDRKPHKQSCFLILRGKKDKTAEDGNKLIYSLRTKQKLCRTEFTAKFSIVTGWCQ